MMRDTRAQRIALALAITAGISAVLTDFFLRPTIERAFRR